MLSSAQSLDESMAVPYSLTLYVCLWRCVPVEKYTSCDPKYRILQGSSALIGISCHIAQTRCTSASISSIYETHIIRNEVQRRLTTTYSSIDRGDDDDDNDDDPRGEAARLQSYISLTMSTSTSMFCPTSPACSNHWLIID